MTLLTPHTSRPLRFASGVRAEHLFLPFRFNANAVALLLVEAVCTLVGGRQRVSRGYLGPLAQQKGASAAAGESQLANCPVSHGVPIGHGPSRSGGAGGSASSSGSSASFAEGGSDLAACLSEPPPASQRQDRLLSGIRQRSGAHIRLGP